jgi:RNA polymerase sigma factor (TIGR02999 family)
MTSHENCFTRIELPTGFVAPNSFERTVSPTTQTAAPDRSSASENVRPEASVQLLRRRARAYLRREGAGHVLQPTALVHETYLRLIRQQRTAWKNRAQFYGVAAQMMRRILVDQARARKMAKRSGQWARVSLADAAAARAASDVDVLDLHMALDALAAFDLRKSRVAELRFFGGLSLEETGEVLQLSIATVEREWRAARAWLYSQLNRTRDGA